MTQLTEDGVFWSCAFFAFNCDCKNLRSIAGFSENKVFGTEKIPFMYLSLLEPSHLRHHKATFLKLQKIASNN